MTGSDEDHYEERRDPVQSAGIFSSWIAEMERALRGQGDSDVPCGSCTACCTSSQFIHIGPDETDTLAHIPKALLFAAPRMSRGNVVMGYDQRGHCPMLVDGQCSIYEHRPRTCRTYDCRVFPAAGLELDDEPDKALIADQVRRWRFDLPTETDVAQLETVRAAARYLQEHRGELPGGSVPSNTTQLAVLAIEMRETFHSARQPDINTVRLELRPRTARVSPIDDKASPLSDGTSRSI